MKKWLILIVLSISPSLVFGQPTFYTTVGIGIEFNSLFKAYFIPKVSFGYIFENESFVNLTVSHTTTKGSQYDHLNIYSEMGTPVGPRGKQTLVGGGVGVTFTDFKRSFDYHYRLNAFSGNIAFVNYTYRFDPQLKNSVGVEFVAMIYPGRYETDLYDIPLELPISL
ncbi:MAG: hypothetical protein HUU10_14250 [Bacteroidetes bacterium]|nr:hypothetical protein [Bacteroidota bacterium]